MKLIEVVQRNYNLVKYQNHAKSSDNSLDPADLTISLQSFTETISEQQNTTYLIYEKL